MSSGSMPSILLFHPSKVKLLLEELEELEILPIDSELKEELEELSILDELDELEEIELEELLELICHQLKTTSQRLMVFKIKYKLLII